MSVGHVGFGNILGVFRATYFKALGKLGATAGASLAGGTISGSPASGPFDEGDLIVDHTGKIWVCTVSGNPGTWVQSGGGVPSNPMNWLGVWSSSTSYSVNDVVLRISSLFIANTPNLNNDPVSSRNYFTGNGSQSSVPFSIGANVTISQTIGGFWYKFGTLPASNIALMDFYDNSSVYYRVVHKSDNHIYVETNVFGIAGSTTLDTITLAINTWYWVSWGSDCPGGAISILGHITPITLSEAADQTTTYSHGTATISASWKFSIGTAASTGAYSNLPSDSYIADVRVRTGNSSSGPFTLPDPDNSVTGVAVLDIPVSESAGAQSVLSDSVDGYNLTGTFTVSAVGWVKLSAS